MPILLCPTPATLGQHLFYHYPAPISRRFPVNPPLMKCCPLHKHVIPYRPQIPTMTVAVSSKASCLRPLHKFKLASPSSCSSSCEVLQPYMFDKATPLQAIYGLMAFLTTHSGEVYKWPRFCWENPPQCDVFLFDGHHVPISAIRDMARRLFQQLEDELPDLLLGFN